MLSDAYKGLILAEKDIKCLTEYSDRLKDIPSEIICHKVNHNDNLNKISKEYGISEGILAKLNGITTQTPITPNHILLAPKKAD